MSKLDAGTNIANNDNGVYEYASPGASANVKMGYWDESFGYVYGEVVNTLRKFQEVFWLLNIWLKTIFMELLKLYDAFKLGRAVCS